MGCDDARSFKSASDWPDHYRHKVEARPDAVALIDTTTGDLLREVLTDALGRSLDQLLASAGSAHNLAHRGYCCAWCRRTRRSIYRVSTGSITLASRPRACV